MKTKLCIVSVALIFAAVYLGEAAAAKKIKCYTCNNCTTPFKPFENRTQTIDCEFGCQKETSSDKNIVNRGCASTNVTNNCTLLDSSPLGVNATVCTCGTVLCNGSQHAMATLYTIGFVTGIAIFLKRIFA